MSEVVCSIMQTIFQTSLAHRGLPESQKRHSGKSAIRDGSDLIGLATISMHLSRI